MRKRRSNPLQVKIKPVALPRVRSRVKYLEGLLQAIEAGEMRDGWEIEVEWRNPETKVGRSAEWQSDELINALESSSDGFRGVVYRTVARELEREKLKPKRKTR